MSDDRTIQVYNERAAEYAANFHRNAPDEDLLRFLGALPSGASILDLGCGTGSATAHMVDEGFDVTGLDASLEMLQHAKKLSAAKFVHARFDDLDEQSVYHGVWANFSLLHAPKESLSLHLSAIHQALKPRGIFHIAMKTGVGSATDTIDRFYSYYSEEELNELLEIAGFEILSSRRGQSKGLAGPIEPWIILLTRKIN